MKKVLLLITIATSLFIPETAEARYYRRRRSSAPLKGLFGGALGGAAIGGLAGGKRGAGIGAGVGAGVGLLSGIAASKRRDRDDYYYDNSDYYNYDY